MTKKKQNKVINLGNNKNEKKVTNVDPVIKHVTKTKRLSDAIFNSITEQSKDGEFSIFEITDVLVKVLHAYNKRFLSQEYQNLRNEAGFEIPQPENEKNV